MTDKYDIHWLLYLVLPPPVVRGLHLLKVVRIRFYGGHFVTQCFDIFFSHCFFLT